MLLVLGMCGSARAQPYVTIPDANFAAYLNTIGVMTGGQLNVSIAQNGNYTTIDCSNRNIGDLTGIEYFTSLASLDCSRNHISYIAAFPSSLTSINCSGNTFSHISIPWPSGLTYLDCSWNDWQYLGNLPPNLQHLNCSFANVNQLDVLPSTLQYLDCSGNYMDIFLPLPAGLTYLDFSDPFHYATYPLQALPNTLTTLKCGGNNFTALPFSLPNSLQTLYCNANHLYALPPLPPHLKDLDCRGNYIFGINDLPDSMNVVQCDDNPQLQMISPLRNIQWLGYTNTNIQCFHGYGSVINSDPPVTNYPLCVNTTITIPDTNFLNWLNNNGYSACLNGNQMDTLCARSINIPTSPNIIITHQNISDFTGLNYLGLFSGYPTTIDLSYNNLHRFPTQLYHFVSQNTSIHLNHNHIDSFFLDNARFSYFDTLDLATNGLQSFKVDSITTNRWYFWTLQLNDNQLSSFPYLGSYVNPSWSSNTRGYCLNIRHNRLVSAPLGNFAVLDCGVNQITTFGLSNSVPTAILLQITADSNLISSVYLPPWEYYYYLNFSHNLLTDLSFVNNKVQTLICTDNQITHIDSLPSDPNYGVRYFDCSHNPLSALPHLPTSLTKLYCSYDSLTSLPALPAVMNTLNCSNNALLRCLPALTTIGTLNFSNTAVNCIPNLGTVTNSTPPLASLPICNLLNGNGCPVAWNIDGKVYQDANSNCILDSFDHIYSNIKVNLFKNGTLQQQAFTDTGGNYSFVSTNGYGNYDVTVDTSVLPYTITCPAVGFIRDSVTANHLYFSGQNFGLQCRNTGADVGTTGVYGHPHVFRPGHSANIKILAGDMASLYSQYHCLTVGNSGTVRVIFDGPITFTGIFPGSQIPVLNGDTLTWTISDFAALNIDTAFWIYFDTDTHALIGAPVCFHIAVSMNGGDINPANDTLTYCFEVHDSHDPNEKEVYPSALVDSTDQWITYSIAYQNTGNAVAENIHIDDTISGQFDISSIQLLSYSHPGFTQVLPGGVIRFNFPEIFLPDSTSDPQGSQGYVRFKIKLMPNIPRGTAIQNTAYIYFDFNNAVVTNTTTNIYSVLPTPIVATAQPTTFCQGDNIMLHRDNYSYFSYQWLKDGTPIGGAADTFLIVDATGAYCTKIIFGSDTSISAPINVTVLPSPNVGLNPSSNSVCIDASPISLNPNPNGGTIAGPAVNNYNFYPSISGTGNFTIGYSITDTNGCTGIATTTITVNPKPTVTLTPSQNTTCENASPIALTGTPVGGTYSGAGVSNTTFNPTTVTIGVNNITYAYIDSNGCSDTASATITVNAKPSVMLTANAVCENGPPATLNGTPSGGNYSGAGVTGNMFYPSVAGISAVHYQYTDSNGCSDTASTTITVNTKPTVALTIPPVCVNAALVLLSATPDGGAYVGIGITGSTFDPAVAGIGTTNISYRYTNANGCSDTTSANVTVLPTPTVTLTTDTSFACLNAPQIPLNGLPPGGTYSGAGVQANVFHAFIAGVGIDTINYTYTDTNGCTDHTYKTITVQVCTGIDAVTGITFTVYPNPATNQLNILTDKPVAGYHLQVMDVVGKQILSSVLTNANLNTIDVSQLAAATYFYSISDKEGRMVYKDKFEVVR